MQPTALTYTVELERKRAFEAIAKRSNRSYAVFFEELVTHLESELDETGVPTWLPKDDEEGVLFTQTD